MGVGVGCVVALGGCASGQPGFEVCVFLGQEFPCHYSIHGRVLDVDMEVVAFHGEDDVQI